MDQNWRMVNLLDFLLVGFTLGAAAGTVLLPYSETQDVGYTLSAPDRVGCYRHWFMRYFVVHSFLIQKFIEVNIDLIEFLF